MVWGLHCCPGGMALENNDFLPYLLHREKDRMMMMNLIYPIIFGARGLNTKNSQTTFHLILSWNKHWKEKMCKNI